jgi:magnesium transporter
VVLFADLIGASLPIVARRLGLDPAAISSPFVTTIVDVSVAVIYLSLVAKLVLWL